MALWLVGVAKAGIYAQGGAWEVALWLALPLPAMLWRLRFGAALMVLAWSPWVLWSGTSHPVFVALVALIVAVFGDDRQRRLVLRTQLTAVYGFSGLAKLVSPAWRGGEVVSGWPDPWLVSLVPLPGVVWGVVLAELGVAVLLWVDDRAALWVGLAMHVGITAGMWWLPGEQFVALWIFNGLAVAVLVVSTVRKSDV